MLTVVPFGSLIAAPCVAVRLNLPEPKLTKLSSVKALLVKIFTFYGSVIITDSAYLGLIATLLIGTSPDAVTFFNSFSIKSFCNIVTP